MEWLEARDTVLSATDIVKLMPAYKRASKANKEAGTIPEFQALWGEKHSLRDRDNKSYGPAARGHIMESYAVDAWNKQFIKDKFYHWDDLLIRRGMIGFSPDAANIMQPCASVVLDMDEIGTMACDGAGGYYDVDIKTIMEIKSYEAKHHFQCVLKDKMKQDEIMQIAVAMYVMPSIEEAVLLFYCPGSPVSMQAFCYKREELQEQIDLVGEFAEQWKKTNDKICTIAGNLDSIYTEDEIYEDWLAMEQDVYALG